MGWVKTEKTNKLSKLGDIDFTTTAPVDGNALVYDETNDVWIPGEGGGSSGVELTQAEYDQLTQEEKNNGTIYQISDKGYFYYKEKQFRAVKELTQAQYDALTPAQKADGTIYMISDATNNLDDLDNVDITNLADGQIIEYNATTQSWVNATNNIANKMDKVDPTGTGSLSLNRKANTTIGTDSVAEGGDTTASGTRSHAEGGGTTASGAQAHAEGGATTASGDNSHAEGGGTSASSSCAHAEGGGTQAISDYSHAEGNSSHAEGLASHAEGANTTASGAQAHAEGAGTTASNAQAHAEGGGTTASGAQSHAEGASTTASGSCSHAEGLGTIAKGSNQHAGGKYNIEDNNDTYAEIIGNGTYNARSNARTLDWSGNEILAGDLTINGNQSVTQALGKIVVQKTQAEYDLLTSAEKNNGSIYKITDKAKMYCLDEEYHAIKEITSAEYAQLTNTEKNNGTLYVITDEETTADDIPYSAGVSVADKLDTIPTYSEGTGIDITSNTISLDVNGLTSVSSLSGTDEIAVYDGTSNKKTTVSAVAAADYTITTSTTDGVNWTVKKYNNGDMEIWGYRDYVPANNVNFTVQGNAYIYQDMYPSFGKTYPESFYSTPIVIGQLAFSNDLSAVSSIYSQGTATMPPSLMAIRGSAATVTTSMHVYKHVYAKGRWKA